MNRFAALLDRLAYEPSRNGKIRHMAAFFRETPDPERGFALGALTGSLAFAEAKPNVIRALVSTRVDPVLFALSHDFVGDLSETTALIWPAAARRPGSNQGPPSLSEVVEALGTLKKRDLPQQLAEWLDELDETGRWALLKLITGALRVGVSARLAKTAVASLAAREPPGADLGDEDSPTPAADDVLDADAVEQVWHGLKPPYAELFAWVEGRGPKPAARDPAPFRPPMLSHPLEDADRRALDPAEFSVEWKWDGIRVQAASGATEDGEVVTRLYSRTGEDVGGAFPDLVTALAGMNAALDGELLVMREGRVESFNVLQQRLNRKAVTLGVMAEYPAHLRVYDLLAEGEEDLRPLPFAERRARLEAFIARLDPSRVDLSPIVRLDAAGGFEAIAAARLDPAGHGAGADADAVEGLMLKRLDSPYLPGRPKGPWWKWKRDPHSVDAVMMYAQRGRGKRSSFYSDYTFGVWADGPDGEALVPVGKAYSGFTDKELVELDRFVRKNTTNRFGPVREVVHGRDAGLVLEVLFEGLQRSTRHRSGLAMRFPRIARIRWDKPAREADRLSTLEALLREEGEAPAGLDPDEGTPTEEVARAAGDAARDAKLGRKA